MGKENNKSRENGEAQKDNKNYSFINLKFFINFYSEDGFY